MVAAIGWTGHAFPAFALARELRGRGHEVTVESFERWRGVVEAHGIDFIAAEEQMELPGIAGAGAPTSLAEAVRRLEPTLARLRPDVVVSDLFTIAPALAAEVAGVPRASLIPHPFPAHEPGLPFYPLGLAPPRTAIGRLGWQALWPVAGTRLPNTRLRRVRASIDLVRAELGLGPQGRYDGQISEQLALVATFPQLEYPRRWPAHVHVTGPMPFELEHPEIELPPGGAPLVLVAPSTERDLRLELVRTALAAFEHEPVRVVATTNRAGLAAELAPPANAVIVDWLSYSQLLAHASLVVCHGGHGTVARALAAGVPILVWPPAGDMAVNGARVAWSGAGLMLPQRLLGETALRRSARTLLADESFESRARELAAWARENDGAATAATLVERLAEARPA